MSRVSRSSGTPALDLLQREGVAHQVREYHHDPDSTDFGAEVVAALGIAPERCLKTLVADCSGELVVAVVAVAHQLDLKALAAATGAKRAALAEAGVAERSSGYVVGGISPLGQRRRLPTVVDVAALGQPSVLVSAGRRGLQVELAAADLVALTRARTAPIAR